MKKVLVGIIVSAIFLYFSFKGTNWNELVQELNNANHLWFIPAVLASIMTLYVKSLRWQVFLEPLVKIPQKDLFPMTCVGFFAIGVFPARTGEIVRPYLVNNKYNISLSSCLATIFLERVIDIVSLILMFVIVILFTGTEYVPDWITSSSYVLFAFSIFLIFMMFYVYYKPNHFLKLISPFIRILPKKYFDKLESIIKKFTEGFAVISNPLRFTYSLFLSFVNWIFSGLIVYFLFYFHDIPLGLLPAYTVLLITMLGIILPAAPGMVGNFHGACILALTPFLVDIEKARAFSISYYVAAIVVTILVGVIALRFVDFSFKDMWKKIKEGLSTSKTSDQT